MLFWTKYYAHGFFLERSTVAHATDVVREIREESETDLLFLFILLRNWKTHSSGYREQRKGEGPHYCFNWVTLLQHVYTLL